MTAKKKKDTNVTLAMAEGREAIPTEAVPFPCPHCDYPKLRNEESRQRHVTRTHPKAAKVTEAKATLTRIHDDVPDKGTSIQAIKGQLIKEEDRRKAAAVVKAAQPKPESPGLYRVTVVIDVQALSDEKAKVKSRELIKDLAKVPGIERTDVTSVLPLW